jgi:hypothetical protein
VRLDHGKAAIFGGARPTRPPFGCYPVTCEQILLPRGSLERRIRSDRPGIRRISVYQMGRAAGLNKEDGSSITKVFERIAG